MRTLGRSLLAAPPRSQIFGGPSGARGIAASTAAGGQGGSVAWAGNRCEPGQGQARTASLETGRWS